LLIHSPCFSETQLFFRVFENGEYRNEADVIVMKIIKDLQYPSFPPVAEKEKENGADVVVMKFGSVMQQRPSSRACRRMGKDKRMRWSTLTMVKNSH
jgi:hypothetical protein